MIELFKLAGLPRTQKIRKIIKILEKLETHCIHTDEFPCDSFYIEGLLRLIQDIYPSDAQITEVLTHTHYQAHSLDQTDNRRLFNTLKHILYEKAGVEPSEWDLIEPGKHYDDRTLSIPYSNETLQRPFFPDVYVYAEDIRAPFNLGSIFRTAEAFGVEKILLSEHCVSPEQKRAKRSAMGCVDFLPWEHCSLEQLPSGMPVFALETGGTPINQFIFPQKGIVLIGSEELGLTNTALKKATAGIVSIPMKGIKASLNVSVAFGILMQWWTNQIMTNQQ